MSQPPPELPPSPPTAQAGPVIDPSSTAVPGEPRPTAPAPPSAASPWYPNFDRPPVRPAGPAVSTAPARARRAAGHHRTRAIVGGASLASFLAILAAVGLHGGSQPASNATTTGGDSPATFDPGFVRPDLGQGSFGSGGSGSGSSSGSGFGSGSGSTTNPFSRRFGGGFSATPGSGGGSADTRSHGS
ncbi:MAG TPA: hypothetical protein VFE55_14720 [Acidimicrobiia bacterium]|nr:hypothetical protein [Acidimicrobiia bacterium]